MTPRLRRALAAAGGPLLIAGVALFLLRGFWLFGRVSLQHVDPLPFWLPMHCHLGETLASGSIPAWNPHVLGGVPFAADPQSGWMYLPAMLLYAALPCTTAFGWFVTLQPVLAGVGLYWFLRVEGLSRPAATVGGLALAGGIAASRVAVTLPFSGSVAWTAVMLGCAARFFRAPGWSGRLGWSVAVAAAWGQVAAAHLSHGLVVATLALAAYAIAAGGRVRPRTRVAWLRAALLLAALVLVNLAFLAPRVPYLARSTLSLGYGGLDALAADLGSPVGSSAEVGASVSPPWILGFATAPGAYLGMAALLLVPAAWALRERRRLAIWIGAFALLCYLLPLRAVASAVASWGAWLPFADFYVHEPSRFRYGVLLALPILAALGIEAWRRGAASARWVAVGAAA
ncbi:MAG TPA: hypothetical protein VM638_07380, partial [Actinomycetota bacterium]|nr:hypothetical protein [Actinomycetota bacterium]